MAEQLRLMRWKPNVPCSNLLLVIQGVGGLLALVLAYILVSWHLLVMEAVSQG